MRILRGMLLAFGVVAGLAACQPLEPASSVAPPVDGSGPPLSSLPAPGSTTRPGVPSPSIEIPPPID